MNAWQQILKCVENKLNRQTYTTWFKPTQFQSLQADNTLHVTVPNLTFESWIVEHFSEILDDAARESHFEDLKIRFHAKKADHPEPAQKNIPYQGELDFTADENLLNPKYTFDRFVVASCNQFAHAAALAVAEAPSRIYNPLFIYGGAGLGKTHLMQAVGHKVRSISKAARLSYVSSEKFTNEVVNAIRYDKTLALREKYRNVDVLLVDDIHFISGKQATQQEFFHTFNTLYDAQKQIVLSSDLLPKEIPDIQNRLTSRLEWGLIADIQMPDLETKVAILKKKAEFESCELPDNVAFFIASKIESNIRELEGSLNRLIAFCSLTGEPISLGMAQRVLKNTLKTRERTVSIERIQKVVADYFSVKVSALKARSNSKAITQPRQIGMYLCRNLTSASLPEVGRAFGGKHHTTVMHSIRKVETKRSNEKDFNNLIDMFLESLE